MKRGFNACQTHCSMYPSIFNCFPVIQPVSSKVRHFSTFLHILVSPGYATGKIAVNVTWMEKDISQKLQLFPTPLHLTPALGCSHWNSGKRFGPQKTRTMGLSGSEDSLTIGWAVSTQCQRVTDRRTDGQTSSLYQERAQYDWRTLKNDKEEKSELQAVRRGSPTCPVGVLA